MAWRRIGLGLLALFVLALGALAWRLDRGPLALPFLADRVEAALAGRGLTGVRVGEVRLAWGGFAEGGLAPVEIILSGVHAALPSGAASAELPRAVLAIPPGALLRGAVAPRRIELRNPTLRLRRAEDGGLDLGPHLGSHLGPLGEPGANPDGASPLDALRRLLVTGGQVIVEDRALGTEWRLGALRLDLRRDPGRGAGGLPEGEAAAELRLAGEAMPLRLTAAEEGDALRLALAAPRLAPGAVARAVPALAPLGLLDAPAALSAEAVLAPEGELRRLAATLEAGPGTLDAPASGRVPFTTLRLQATATPEAVRLDRALLELAPGPEGVMGPTLTATGRATRDAGGWEGEAELALDRAELPALETWWPVGLAPAARDWVARNLVAGVLRDGRWQAAATAPPDLGSVALTRLDGTARLEDVAVRWHPGLPPLEGLTGTADFGADAITLHVTGARQAGTALRLPDGRLRLTGLGAGPARAELRGRLTGPVADLWALLRRPELGLLAGAELPVRNPTGTLDAEVTAAIPLAGPDAATDPTWHVAATLSELRLPDLVLGRTLSDGAFDVTLDPEGLRAEGTARLGAIPFRGRLALPLGAGQDGSGLRIAAQAEPEAAQLAALGLNPGEVLQGPVALDIRYAAAGAAPARLTLRAGLDRARLAIAPLGYEKPRGAPAAAEAVLRLADGALRSVERVELAAPDLVLRARAVEGEDALAITEARIGETRFTGRLQPPAAEGGAWAVALRGPVLDLRPILESAGGGAGPPGAGLPPLTLDARFDRAPTPPPAAPLQDLRIRASLREGGLAEAQAAASGPAPFTATLSSRPEGGRALRLEAADAGALLAGLGLASPLEGGRLVLAATQPSTAADAPIAGTAELTDATLRDAPAAAKLLQALTGYGLLDALSGPGLGISRLVAPFRLDGGVLTLEEARAFSASLGLTATGRIDLRGRTLDLEGTIVPAYVFNTLLGNLPIIGRLFSPERGGGLFAATFEADGPWRDPRVSVNPLAALTPGFLRGLFELGEEPEPAAGSPAP
jgi:hypothetical protein